MNRITSGTVFIWVSLWEYQCCGTPIRAGEIVDLTVAQHDDELWTADVGGPVALAATLHAPPEGVYHLRVRVDRLWEARARRAPDTGDGWSALPGSGEVADVPVMRPWEEDWQPARHGGEPSGWILRAHILEELPPRSGGLPYGLNVPPSSAASR